MGRFPLNISPLYLLGLGHIALTGIVVLQHHQQRVLEDRLLDLAVKSADHREVQVNPDPSPGGESAKTTHRFEGPPIFPAVGPKPEAGFREQGLLSIALLLLVFWLAVVVAVKILQSRTSKKQETVEGAPSPRQLAQRQLAELRLRRHGIGESLHSAEVVA